MSHEENIKLLEKKTIHLDKKVERIDKTVKEHSDKLINFDETLTNIERKILTKLNELNNKLPKKIFPTWSKVLGYIILVLLLLANLGK